MKTDWNEWLCGISILGLSLIGLFLITGCERRNEVPQKVTILSNSTAMPAQPKDDKGTNGWYWDQARADELKERVNKGQDVEAFLAYSAMLREKHMHESLAREVTLPNFATGPGLPRPLGFNFYSVDEQFKEYLLCEYDVSENHFDESNEPEWFRASLLQTRSYGRDRFPPIQWVAVVIKNRAEHTGIGSFEKSFKAGVVINAADVFDADCDLRRSIAEAGTDLHPFQYDPKGKPDQRWLMVEKHAATNRLAASLRRP
jgi:hypothetical protein